VSTPQPSHLPTIAIPTELFDQLRSIGDLLDVGNDIKDFGHELTETKLSGLPCDTDYKRVAYTILCKGFRTFQATQTLCRCGYGPDGLGLCGSLFENVVDLLYIGQAPKRRPRRYMQFEQVQKLYQVRKVLRKKRLPKGRRKYYRTIEHRLNAELAPLMKYFPREARDWSQKSLADRARAVGADLDYKERYWIFCGNKHTSPMASIGWISSAPGETLAELVIKGPDIRGVFFAAHESAELFLRLCRIFQHELDLALDTEIQKLEAALLSTAAATQASHPDLCDLE
jgi:hypothetical protein